MMPLIVHVIVVIILLYIAYGVPHSKWSQVFAFVAGFGALSAMQDIAGLYVMWVFTQ